jgi:Tol biopolymer transport system component
MDGDGGNLRRVTNGASDDSGVALAEDLAWSQASWSPHGDTIAFDGKYLANGPPCEPHCAGWDVLVIGSDGSRLERVALGARAPAWSPDGRRLASRVHVLAHEPAGLIWWRSPVWTPDGRKILVASQSLAERFSGIAVTTITRGIVTLRSADRCQN